MENPLERCGQALKHRGMQLSHPRLLILEQLSRTGAHMTAEELYDSVREQAPGISRTTVYNVLKAFTKEGIARTVSILGGRAMYELARDGHAHFQCERCLRVEDVMMDLGPVLSACPDGFSPQRAEVHFHGVCNECAAKGLA